MMRKTVYPICRSEILLLTVGFSLLLAAGPAARAAVVTLCPGVTADSSGQQPATAAFQTCIDSTKAGGTLEIPAGTYLINGRVLITKPITLRTAGTADSTDTCETPGMNCAVLLAAPDLYVVAGFLRACDADPMTGACREIANLTLDHLVLDGNRAARQDSAAANECRAGRNGYGFNASVHNCRACLFTYSVSKNALCGTGLEYSGHDAGLWGNVFRNNGQNPSASLWSDGLTVHWSDRAVITDNRFIDNTDIHFIAGGGREALFANNTVTQQTQLAFGGVMLDNFNNSTPGDFSGALVTGNVIDCGPHLCHFGINLGPHAWYLSRNITGGTVAGNVVTNARQGINIDGAGTADNPIVVYDNDVSSSPPQASFLCGLRPTSNININTADSNVDRNGDPTPFTTRQWHGCP